MYTPLPGSVADRALKIMRTRRKPITLRELSDILGERREGMPAMMKYALKAGLCKRERLIGDRGLCDYWSVKNPFVGVDIDAVHKGR